MNVLLWTDKEKKMDGVIASLRQALNCCISVVYSKKTLLASLRSISVDLVVLEGEAAQLGRHLKKIQTMQKAVKNFNS